MRARVAVVIPAKNEEKNLEKTLDSLNTQTLKPEFIVLVDDGSKDRTADVAMSHGVSVLRRPDRGFRATGSPLLAEVINYGLMEIQKREPWDYVMVLGADHILTKNYIDEIVRRMRRDPEVVIASGIIVSEDKFNRYPRGSGRVVKYSFWTEIGFRYPIYYGWEAYILYKALQKGYKLAVYKDLRTYVQRKTGRFTKYLEYGRGMQALGYDQLYALGKAIFSSLEQKDIKVFVKLMAGYSSLMIHHYDVAPFVRKMQRYFIARQVLRMFSFN
jgi:glycosyltransferase involved in cell wall biosynthesis